MQKMFTAQIDSDTYDGETSYDMRVVYKSPQVNLSFSVEDLPAMFNRDLSGRGESNGYGRCRIEGDTLTVEVDKSGTGCGGNISVAIDLSDDETRASLDRVIEQWKALDSTHEYIEV